MTRQKQKATAMRKIEVSIKLIFRIFLSVIRKMRDRLNPLIQVISRSFRKVAVNLQHLFQLLFPFIRKTGKRLGPLFQLILPAIAKAGAYLKLRFRSMIALTRRMSLRKKLIALLLFSCFLSVFWIQHLHTLYYGPNVIRNLTLFIHDEDDFERVVTNLKENGCLAKVETFRRFAGIKGYDTNIKPGAYRLLLGWSNNQLINALKSGAQTPVMVTFNSIRTREELAGKLAKQLQSDSLSFLTLFRNDSSAVKLGFNAKTLPALFIPNTYSFYWTTTPAGFLTRMKREYDLFWNETRRMKAKSAGLTTDQVATLASIVQEESNKNDDKPVIAGVYLNRLRKNWPLQADPTIRFALGDFTIRRILTDQLTVDSPYNTYKNIGLPPGPINFPEISSLEAVLNYKVHDYYYFCAKEDFSGYTNFAKTLSEHNRNARKYQEALNKMKVFK